MGDDGMMNRSRRRRGFHSSKQARLEIIFPESTLTRASNLPASASTREAGLDPLWTRGYRVLGDSLLLVLFNLLKSKHESPTRHGVIVQHRVLNTQQLPKIEEVLLYIFLFEQLYLSRLE